MIPYIANKHIYTTEAVEREGNRIMDHQRGRFFIMEDVLVESVTQAHKVNVDRHKVITSLMAGGEVLPHIVVDKDSVVMDGNTRVEACKDLEVERIWVFKAVGEIYRDEDE